jgi:Flp pilus assembly pilin Flp
MRNNFDTPLDILNLRGDWGDNSQWRRSDPMTNQIWSFMHDEQGQDLIEYTLLTAFLALLSCALFLGAGGSIKGIWVVTNNQLAQANAMAS